jgi:hypothetical protein
MDIELSDLEAIVARAGAGPLSTEDREKLKAAIDTLAFLTQELERKGTSIDRLRRLIFGASTEKTSTVLGKPPDVGDAGTSTDKDKTSGEKKKGHGRNGAAAFTGARKVAVPHEALKSGDICPECEKGKVYPEKDPAVMVRITGMAPIQAVVYEMQRLRCNLCGVVRAPSRHRADGPEDGHEEGRDPCAQARGREPGQAHHPRGQEQERQAAGRADLG